MWLISFSLSSDEVFDLFKEHEIKSAKNSAY